MARLGVFLLAAMLTNTVSAAAQSIPAEWEVRDVALALSRQLDAMSVVLRRLEPSRWEGAPQAYAEQQDSAEREAGYAAGAARELANEPKALSKAFELHLRAESLESLVTSLAAGARTYQSPESAEETLNALAQVSPGQAKLRQYLVELAAWKERELATADTEAQRCRADISRQTPAAPKSKGTSK